MALKRYGQITNAEAYFEDNTLVGIIKELDLPEIEWETVEHETLGQVAVFKAPARPLKALEGEMTFGFVEPTIAGMTYMPTKAFTFQLHHNVDVWDQNGLSMEESFKLVTVVRVLFHSSKLGGSKLGDLVDHKVKFTCNRFVQSVYQTGEELIGVDVMANRAWNRDGEIWPS